MMFFQSILVIVVNLLATVQVSRSTTCVSLKVIRHGDAECDKKLQVGTRCQISCHGGYSPVGATERICQADGLWAPHNPTYCTRKCEMDFEKGAEEWIKTGTAFNNQPTYGDNPTHRNRESSKHQGDYWIGGAEDRSSPAGTAGGRQGDSPTGTMTSPLFSIRGTKLSFLIGGGCDINVVRAELLVDGNVVRRSTGKCAESMERAEWDVTAFKGKPALVRLVDSSSGVWGHINFDDLRGDDCFTFLQCDMDFEKSIGLWVKTGTAFDNQPTYGENPAYRGSTSSKHQGSYWIGSFEDRSRPSKPAGGIQGDKPTGTMTSPSFRIKGNTLSFLVGGGCDINNERAELIIEGKVIYRKTGKCIHHSEAMERAVWDVARFQGKSAQVRLVDSSSEGWGHINFDDLRGDTCIYTCTMDFENGVNRWVRTGTAFNNQPTYGDNPAHRNRGSSKHHGNFWIGSFENRPSPSHSAGAVQGDGYQGTMTSPSFSISGTKLSFLIGGGCDINTVRAELVVDGNVVRRSTGKCAESMERAVWDVTPFQGKKGQVRLVDNSSGGWGHINFDDLRGDAGCI